MNTPIGASNDSNAPWYENKYGEQDCHVCNGEKTYEDAVCMHCDGLGKIPITREEYEERCQEISAELKSDK